MGRSAANLLAGGGWTWPATTAEGRTGLPVPSPLGSAFWGSLPQVLAGDAGAGLTPRPDVLAGPGLLWGCVAATELAALTLIAWAAIRAYLRWGPGRLRGMATRAEAEQLLGLTRIRKVAAIVRPDLHGHPHLPVTPPPRTDTVDAVERKALPELPPPHRGTAGWRRP